jgi:hypothetical protein
MVGIVPVKRGVDEADSDLARTEASPSAQQPQELLLRGRSTTRARLLDAESRWMRQGAGGGFTTVLAQ